jgi:hypothetical protein
VFPSWRARRTRLHFRPYDRDGRRQHQHPPDA